MGGGGFGVRVFYLKHLQCFFFFFVLHLIANVVCFVSFFFFGFCFLKNRKERQESFYYVLCHKVHEIRNTNMDNLRDTENTTIADILYKYVRKNELLQGARLNLQTTIRPFISMKLIDHYPYFG